MPKPALRSTNPSRVRFAGLAVPRIISDIDIDTAEIFAVFFECRLRDEATRRQHAKAIVEFCDWLDCRRHDLYELRPMTVSVYLEHLRFRTSPKIAKEHWIALRILFEWVVQRGILESNPAAMVLDPELGLAWPEPIEDEPAGTSLIEIVADPLRA